MCLCQQQKNRASSLAKNSTLMDQPQKKPVVGWCLAGKVEWLQESSAGRSKLLPRCDAVGRMAEIYQVLWSLTEHIMTLSLYATRSSTSNQCSSVCRNHEPFQKHGLDDWPLIFLLHLFQWGLSHMPKLSMCSLT